MSWHKGANDVVAPDRRAELRDPRSLVRISDVAPTLTSTLTSAFAGDGDLNLVATFDDRLRQR
jgi:hypothetical protein